MNGSMGWLRGPVRALLVIVVVLGAAGCGDGVGPEGVAVTGPWIMDFEQAPSDFYLDLTEGGDGTIAGTWSFPSIFAFNHVRGHRAGLDVYLTADSPNLLPVQINVRLVASDRMEGDFYFAGTHDRVILRRGEPRLEP